MATITTTADDRHHHELRQPQTQHPWHGHRDRRHRDLRDLLRGALHLHSPHRLQAGRRGEPAGVLLAVELRPVRQPGAGVRGPGLPDDHRLHQQRDPHRGQRRRDGHLQRHGRLRLAAPSQSAQPADQRPDPGRPDRAARHRAHHLGPAGPRPVQDHARPDPDRDRLRASVLHPVVPRLHVDGAHGSSTRPPWWTEPDPSRSSSG